jgi:transcriptional/translational regulatory protein YebC/TACO1
MASTYKTNYLGLNKFVGSDKPKMDDFNFDGDVFEISTDPNELGTVRDALEKAGYSFLSAEVEYVPQTMSTIEDEETAAKMEKLIDMLEENDDVQAVWHNWDMPEE